MKTEDRVVEAIKNSVTKGNPETDLANCYIDLRHLVDNMCKVVHEEKRDLVAEQRESLREQIRGRRGK